MNSVYLEDFFLFDDIGDMEASCLGAVYHIFFFFFLIRWVLSFSYYYSIYYIITSSVVFLIPIILFLEWEEVLICFHFLIYFKIFLVLFVFFFVIFLIISINFLYFLITTSYTPHYFCNFIENLKYRCLMNWKKTDNKYALKYFLSNSAINYNKFLGYYYFVLLFVFLFVSVYYFKDFLKINFINIFFFINTYLIDILIYIFFFFFFKLLINSFFFKKLLKNSPINFWNYNYTGEILDLRLTNEDWVSYFQTITTTNIEAEELYILANEFESPNLISILNYKANPLYECRQYRFYLNTEFTYYKSFLFDSYDNNFFYKFFKPINYYMDLYLPDTYTRNEFNEIMHFIEEDLKFKL